MSFVRLLKTLLLGPRVTERPMPPVVQPAELDTAASALRAVLADLYGDRVEGAFDEHGDCSGADAGLLHAESEWCLAFPVDGGGGRVFSDGGGDGAWRSGRKTGGI